MGRGSHHLLLSRLTWNQGQRVKLALKPYKKKMTGSTEGQSPKRFQAPHFKHSSQINGNCAFCELQCVSGPRAPDGE